MASSRGKKGKGTAGGGQQAGRGGRGAAEERPAGGAGPSRATRKSVHFAAGPLSNSPDGHPKHEGQLAKKVRDLGNKFASVRVVGWKVWSSRLASPRSGAATLHHKGRNQCQA